MNTTLLIVALSSSFVVTSIGCSSNSPKPTEIAATESAYDRGLEAFRASNFSQARDEFSKALDTPGLNPDLFVAALLRRSRCSAELGDFDRAKQDVDRAETGATEMDKVFLTRSYVLKKQGDVAGARAEFEKARQIDPQAIQP